MASAAVDAATKSGTESEAQPNGDAMRWTVGQVAEALGVAAPARLDALAGLAGVSIDSRTIQPGELFVAIHGPRHDGHDHVAAALARGAVSRSGRARTLCAIPGRNPRKTFCGGRHARSAAPAWPRAHAKDGAGRNRGGGSAAWPVRSAKRLQKKSLRRWWPRGSAY